MSDPKETELTIDQSLCIQCGNCVATYPELFEFADGGTEVRVKKDADFSGKDIKQVKAVCPVSAIVDQSKKNGKKGAQKKLPSPKKKK